MNCKPGDIARIVHPSEYGRLVEVLYAAPAGCIFTLPDGHKHHPVDLACWVFQMLGSPIEVPIGSDKRRAARYAACADMWLRPIRDPGADAQDETLSWLPSPMAEINAIKRGEVAHG